MNAFFPTSQNVNVSRLSHDGWWTENTVEHVAKGTALGSDFTQNIYIPSKPGMISRYHAETDSWSPEILNMTWNIYYDIHGQKFFIGEPDGDYPDWAIIDPPPEYDPETHTVLYRKETGWTIFKIQLGESFYDEFGQEFLVSDYNFDLPENHTWEEPPKNQDGHAVKLIDGYWQQLIDYREKMAYAKDRDNDEDYIIEELGELPESHTLLTPGAYDSWVNNVGWVYDLERHRPFKSLEERAWRDSALIKVINRVDQYEKDRNYPEELRTSTLTDKEFLVLLQERKLLSDYPQQDGFPFIQRPVLSVLID